MTLLDERYLPRSKEGFDESGLITCLKTDIEVICSNNYSSPYIITL